MRPAVVLVRNPKNSFVKWRFFSSFTPFVRSEQTEIACRLSDGPFDFFSFFRVRICYYFHKLSSLLRYVLIIARDWWIYSSVKPECLAFNYNIFGWRTRLNPIIIIITKIMVEMRTSIIFDRSRLILEFFLRENLFDESITCLTRADGSWAAWNSKDVFSAWKWRGRMARIWLVYSHENNEKILVFAIESSLGEALISQSLLND